MICIFLIVFIISCPSLRDLQLYTVRSQTDVYPFSHTNTVMKCEIFLKIAVALLGNPKANMINVYVQKSSNIYTKYPL